MSVDDAALPATQLALLDAAAKAFTTYGYTAASIDLIAGQIGVTKGSVYYHYRSKGELFFAVHKRAMTINFKAQLPIVQDASLAPPRQLFEMALRHATLMMELFHYQRVTVQGVELHQSSSTTPLEREALAEVVAMRDAYEALFIRVLQRGIDAGHFAPLKASLAAKSILGSLNWITVWFRPKERESSAGIAQVAEQFARQAVASVSRPASGRGLAVKPDAGLRS